MSRGCQWPASFTNMAGPLLTDWDPSASSSSEVYFKITGADVVSVAFVNVTLFRHSESMGLMGIYLC